MNKTRGFTLVELIVVIIILGVLSVTALSRFSGLSSDARAAVLNGIKSAVESTNKSLRVTSFLNAYSTKICPQFADGRVVEIYLDGSAPPSGNCNLTATRNNPDVALLIWGWLDNDELANTINISGDIEETTDSGSPFANTYLGYDLNEDGNVINDNCYYHYRQPLTDGEIPFSEIEDSGC